MPRFTSQEDYNEGMHIYSDFVFGNINSGRMSVQEAGRLLPNSSHLEDEPDIESDEEFEEYWQTASPAQHAAANQRDLDILRAYHERDAHIEKEYFEALDAKHDCWNDIQEMLRFSKRVRNFKMS